MIQTNKQLSNGSASYSSASSTSSSTSSNSKSTKPTNFNNSSFSIKDLINNNNNNSDHHISNQAKNLHLILHQVKIKNQNQLIIINQMMIKMNKIKHY